MHITPIARIHPAQLKEMAEFAADFEQGPLANPFHEGSSAYADWNRIYYARVKENAEAVVS